MVTRVNGGIINDQSLAGSLLYFKIVGAFAYTVSDGTVTLPGKVSGGDTGAVVNYYPQVPTGKPVPTSLAERVLSVISNKCSIVSVGIVGVPGSETAIHIAVSGTGFGWINSSGAVDTAAIVAAVTATLGATVTVPTTSGSASNQTAPATASRSTTVTVTQVTNLILA